jgi:hypothetical protein
MTLAAFSDKHGQSIDDGIAATASGAAEARGNGFQAMVADRACDPAKGFLGEAHAAILFGASVWKRLKWAGRDTMKTL